MNQSQNENKLLTEEGFEFIGTDGKTYKCAMWGDTPWIFYKHPDGQWVSLKQTNQTGVWAAYEQRVNAESPIYPKKQSYQERVQALAEEMAKDSYNRKIPPTTVAGKRIYYSWDDFKLKCAWIADELPRARIAVADTAQAVRKALRMDGIMTSETIEYWLESEGLIPDDGQGVGRKIVTLTCENCGTKWQGEEPKMCCNGTDCGCMGLPVDGPICCDEKCLNELMVKLNQNNGQEACSDEKR